MSRSSSVGAGLCRAGQVLGGDNGVIEKAPLRKVSHFAMTRSGRADASAMTVY